MLELAVCFETSFEEAVQRKTLKYLDLREEAHSRGLKAELMMIKVGSRGVVSAKGFKFHAKMTIRKNLDNFFLKLKK